VKNIRQSIVVIIETVGCLIQVGNYYNETIFYVWNDALTQKLELELGCSTLIIDEDRANNLLRFMVMMIERLVADPGITLEDMTSYKIFTPMVDSSITQSTGNRSNPKNKSMYYCLQGDL
jgi:hypothetical protein